MAANKYKCQRCGGHNFLGRVATDGLIINECETRCQGCGYVDFWAHGKFKKRTKKAARYAIECVVLHLFDVVVGKIKSKFLREVRYGEKD